MDYVEDSVLPEDDETAREIVLARSWFEVIDGVLYPVEKDKTL